MQGLSPGCAHHDGKEAVRSFVRLLPSGFNYCMYVYYWRTYKKAMSERGEGEKGGHVLKDTTSRRRRRPGCAFE